MDITLKDITRSGLVKPPLQIRSLGSISNDYGMITVEGEIELAGVAYSSLDQAMQKVLTVPLQSVTSTGWQFWGFYCEERESWTPLEHLRAQLACKTRQTDIRTSATHPLRVDKIEMPGYPGKLGLTFCPGKRSEGLYGGTWERDLQTDLAALERVGTAMLISVMEQHEFALLEVDRFPETLIEYSFIWRHLPIKDMSTPSINFEQQWQHTLPEIRQLLSRGELIVIHCRGGLGRTGLLAARILVESGLPPLAAVKKVKSARANAIETYGQEEYVLNRSWENINKER